MALEDKYEELDEEFGMLGLAFSKNEKSKILEKCMKTMEAWQLSASDFVSAVMAFCATSKHDVVTLEVISEFEKQDKEKLKSTDADVQPKVSTESKQLHVFGDDTRVKFEMVELEDDETDSMLKCYGAAIPMRVQKIETPDRKPVVGHVRNSEVFASPAVGFSPSGYSPLVQSASKNYRSRSDVVLRFHTKNDTDWNNDANTKTDWEVSVISKIPTKQFKYMFQKNVEVALTINDFLSKLGMSIIDECKLEFPQDLRQSCTEDSVFVGRIRNYEGKLGASNVYMEGTLDESEGHALALDVSPLDEYYLFPGQVVAVTGQNNLGKCVRVSKLHTPVQLPFSQRCIQVDNATGPMDLLITCGPFTPTDSMNYEPFKDLLNVIKTTKPHICIFMGPFLDSNHSIIESGSLDKTFETMFSNLMSVIDNTLEGINTHIIFVPNCKDAHSDNVYPTPQYNHTFKNIRATFTADPSVLSVGGISIAVTSTDILMHLVKHEFCQSAMSLDRMSRLSRHILSQRNFYPLYPADESVPFDVEHWAGLTQLDHNPHILILPSDLKHFIKNVDGTIVVNPERLTKGSCGGTYARLRITVPDEKMETADLSTEVADIIVGEIIKI